MYECYIVVVFKLPDFDTGGSSRWRSDGSWSKYDTYKSRRLTRLGYILFPE